MSSRSTDNFRLVLLRKLKYKLYIEPPKRLEKVLKNFSVNNN